MSLQRAIVMTGLLSMGTVPAGTADFGAALASELAKTCVPQRMSYEGSLAEAKTHGWLPIEQVSHPEFAAVMERSAAGLKAARDEGIAIDFQSQAFAKTVDDRPLHLLVSLAKTKESDEVSCYLYDFDAVAPADPAPLSAILGLAPADSVDTAELVAHAWGPPPAMDRAGDTYLTYLPKGSPHAATAGFDGVVLKFSTSIPQAGE